MNAITNLLFSLTPYILILGAVIFWIYSKGRVRQPYRSIIGISLILLPVCFYGFIFLKIFYVSTYDFSSEQWNEKKSERWRMEEDLIKSRLLIGKDSAQVKNLLSEPEQRNDSLHTWSYDTGQGGGGFGFLFHYLTVSYKDGIVISVEKHQIKD